ncbi:1-acyl-sn-glycerol-3-phosphate acyltransferase [Collimonas fungivorans Ter331]|uniref:1-acyl-sn-glycerol-3-phosphate acyltransferase n=2 Tax=Collimonas fungivorans TaxID=158899 RepID=G0AK34_COLFT|nr:1-acyl-sn-glycerol-3-phosphate acyltransferase [Collimonas fungivorans Ter331]
MGAAGAGSVMRMIKHANRYWRVLATGFSFVLFALGGLLLRILVFPVLNLLIWERQLRVLVARRVIRLVFRGFVGCMRWLGVLDYDIRGLERLERQGLLILANHPTLIDTVFLMAFVKRADCIVKRRLWDNPFTRGPIRAAGYISNEYCGNEHGGGLIEDCTRSLQRGSNLIIFPEGTRTAGDGQINLKRGAANIAVRSLSNVTPIVIRCLPPTLGKGVKWWQVPPIAAHFSIEVKEDIDVHEFLAKAGSEVLAARHLTAYLQDYFRKESQGYAAA